MWLYLKHESNFFTAPQLNVLHIAPEQCFHSTFKAQKNLNYLTGDLVSPIADLHFDLHEIPLEDARFDVIFCNHVLEHVENDFQCMQEIRRVLKPSGFALLQSPQRYDLATTYEDATITDPKQREIHFLQDDHLRIYGRDYGDQLKKSGFTIKEVNMIEKLGLIKSTEMGLPLNEIIYLATK
jgi:SAM-dependent methyltransferase